MLTDFNLSLLISGLRNMWMGFFWTKLNLDLIDVDQRYFGGSTLRGSQQQKMGFFWLINPIPGENLFLKNAMKSDILGLRGKFFKNLQLVKIFKKRLEWSFNDYLIKILQNLFIKTILMRATFKFLKTFRNSIEMLANFFERNRIP